MEKRKERGVTLVETIIAIALVVMISVFVLSTCNFSIKIQNKNVTERFFANQTENVALCIYHSDSNLNQDFMSDFQKIFKFLTDIENPENYLDYEKDEEEKIHKINIYYAKDFSYSNLSSIDETAVYKMIVNFDESTIKCLNIKNENVIFESEV